MTAQYPAPPELAELAETLAAAMSEHARGQLHELAQVLTDAVSVQSRASDRFSTLVTTVPTVGATTIVPATPDRARVTLVNTGSVAVALGAGSGVTMTGLDRFPLDAGASVTIDTKAAVWAIAEAAGATVAVLTEEFDT